MYKQKIYEEKNISDESLWDKKQIKNKSKNHKMQNKKQNSSNNNKNTMELVFCWPSTPGQEISHSIWLL